MSIRRVVTLAPLVAAVASCGPKNVEPAVPLVGWHTAEGWAGSCYHPPDYGSLDDVARKMARSGALDEMISQWNGGRGDGVAFDGDMIEDLEIVLLGRPGRIEQVSRENLEHCKQVMSGAKAAGEWKSWVKGLSSALTAGECNTPFDYTMFDYLDINTGWQRTLPICQDDRVVIRGTENDRYRITEDGPLMNVEGDPSQPAAGTNLPCNLEGCVRGQLIAKFVGESGVETIFPVGVSATFSAPEHGEISYRINDDTLFDNRWNKRGTIYDHTAVEISPAH